MLHMARQFYFFTCFFLFSSRYRRRHWVIFFYLTRKNSKTYARHYAYTEITRSRGLRRDTQTTTCFYTTVQPCVTPNRTCTYPGYNTSEHEREKKKGTKRSLQRRILPLPWIEMTVTNKKTTLPFLHVINNVPLKKSQ